MVATDAALRNLTSHIPIHASTKKVQDRVEESRKQRKMQSQSQVQMLEDFENPTANEKKESELC